MSVWEDGKKLLEEGEVEFLRQTEEKKYFKVKDYNVDVGRWNELTCGCYFGVTHGVKGRLCKHKVAVILWLCEKS